MPSAQLDTDTKYSNLVDTYNRLYSERYQSLEQKPNCKIFENILESLDWLTNGTDQYLNDLLQNYSKIETSNLIDHNDRKINVLVTGSLYLVGLTLKVLHFKID